MALQRKTAYAGIIGLLAGIIIAGGVAVLAVNNNNQGVMKMMGMNTSRIRDDSAGHMGMSGQDMTAELQNHTGDNFDENFLAMMIVHHQGAIDMAKLAETRAKHDEVKNLAKDILSAQSTEIDLMTSWQSRWGYKDVPKSHMTH
ncbi:MAG TPA: DUF305 domain-containing protein [Candidatus Saccharimonadales bacterium]|nr:DUF305 domain-containing protein [Candidatus Saccharimonadales bacterium]